MKKLKIYLATSIESARRPKEEMLAYAEQVAQSIESDGHTVYRPWKVYIPNAWNMSNIEWSQEVAVKDIAAINAADLVVAVVYDRCEATPGTMFELGYCYARGIPVDIVVHESAKKISLMLAPFADHIYFGFNNFKKDICNIDVEMC